MDRQLLFYRLKAGHLQNVKFRDMVDLLRGFGFTLERISGSHQIFKHKVIHIQLNLQNIGGEAKPYQIRQFLKIAEEYNLPVEG